MAFIKQVKIKMFCKKVFSFSENERFSLGGTFSPKLWNYCKLRMRKNIHGFWEYANLCDCENGSRIYCNLVPGLLTLYSLQVCKNYSDWKLLLLKVLRGYHFWNTLHVCFEENNTIQHFFFIQRIFIFSNKNLNKMCVFS